jgi:hypothetical protein
MTISGLREKSPSRLLKPGKTSERNHSVVQSKESLATPDEINGLVEQFGTSVSEVVEVTKEILDTRHRH